MALTLGFNINPPLWILSNIAMKDKQAPLYTYFTTGKKKQTKDKDSLNGRMS